MMAMADLAQNKNHHPVALTDISLRQGISIQYLEQIFLKLKRNKLVNSTRGPSGGYALSKDPEQIKLSNIIAAVNEEVKTNKCSKHSKKGCNGKSMKCITHDLWYELGVHINKFFEEKNLSDVISMVRQI